MQKLLRPLLLLLSASSSLCGCARHAPAPASAAAAPVASCLPSGDGYLRVRMRGGRNLDIDWRDAQLQCDGGPRPDQRGIRVTFAGPEQHDGHRLRFVFGIPGVLGAPSSRDVPANVTVIFEGDKLYSTRGEDKCTIDDLEQSPVTAHTRRVSGRGFCVAAAEVVGASSGDGGDGLLLSRFDFAGIMTDD